jgi:hypothetical protein
MKNKNRNYGEEPESVNFWYEAGRARGAGQVFIQKAVEAPHFSAPLFSSFVEYLK